MTKSSITDEKYHIGPVGPGYVQVYTGDGKGKTTAALGLAMRAAGAGLRVYIGQFIKEMEYGEIDMLRERFPEVEVELFGTPEGCIIDRDADEEDRNAAKAGFAKAQEAMQSGSFDLVILDELAVAMSLGLVPEEEVLEMIRQKPEGVELVITGRGASEELIRCADLVTEMKEIRHYYRQGVLSRKGIEC